jgi:hypothetical protein
MYIDQYNISEVPIQLYRHSVWAHVRWHTSGPYSASSQTFVSVSLVTYVSAAVILPLQFSNVRWQW